MRRLYEQLSAGDIDGFGDLLADDFNEHEAMPGLPPGKAGAVLLFQMFRASFPDFTMTPEDVLVDGDRAVARIRLTGTQRGDFMGVPASNKSVNIRLIDITRFGADGLAHEHWGVLDMFGLMQQLGAVPAGPPA